MQRCARSHAELAEALRLSVRHRSGNTVFTSTIYEPGSSWTARWSWWHKIPLSALDGDDEGPLLIVSERRDGNGYCVLAVPRVWLRERRSLLATFGPHPFLKLLLSAEEAELFVDGPSGLNFAQWKIV